MNTNQLFTVLSHANPTWPRTMILAAARFYTGKLTREQLEWAVGKAAAAIIIRDR
jgi:hypothetical protein